MTEFDGLWWRKDTQEEYDIKIKKQIDVIRRMKANA